MHVIAERERDLRNSFNNKKNNVVLMLNSASVQVEQERVSSSRKILKLKLANSNKVTAHKRLAVLFFFFLDKGAILNGHAVRYIGTKNSSDAYPTQRTWIGSKAQFGIQPKSILLSLHIDFDSLSQLAAIPYTT